MPETQPTMTLQTLLAAYPNTSALRQGELRSSLVYFAFADVKIANKTGTLGLLVADSSLYKETTFTMIQLRQLLADIQANPRKYFTFSVF